MTQTKEDLVESFPSMETAVFKRKIYGVCVMYGMTNYKILKEKMHIDMFPVDKYYTIDDKKNESSTNKKKVSKANIPTKRTPVKINNKKENKKENNDETTDEPADEPADEPSDELADETDNFIKSEPAKKKSKSFPLVFNKNAKTYIDFIISRFLWELFSIDSSNEWPKNMEDMELYALKHVKENFAKCNITELIIHSVKVFKPSNVISESYGLDKELRTKFDEYLDNANVSNFASIFITDFLKLLTIFFSNNFWLEKSQTVNVKYFHNILRYIELAIPSSCTTISSGLLSEMELYDTIINVNKTDVKKGTKSAKNKNAKAEEETDDEADTEVSKKKAVIKTKDTEVSKKKDVVIKSKDTESAKKKEAIIKSKDTEPSKKKDTEPSKKKDAVIKSKDIEPAKKKESVIKKKDIEPSKKKDIEPEDNDEADEDNEGDFNNYEDE